ncbi:MAG: MerR family transcriptional regulator [Nitrospirota bacterium]|jgi:DNA-binding transcriptional MerR regulator
MYKSVSELPKPETPIPDKLFYKIGEVSRIVGVEPYVLRYWETEFPFLKPRKNKSGQRVYIKKDVEFLLYIKRLLYQERYTIEGVRKRIGGTPIRAVEPDPEVKTKETRKPFVVIEQVKKRLRDILSQFH